jgi:hypothetical protein
MHCKLFSCDSSAAAEIMASLPAAAMQHQEACLLLQLVK